MPRPTITQIPGRYPRAPLEDDDVSDLLTTMVNEHAAALDELEINGVGGEALNVTAYGAVGDGETDDSTAITEALAAATAAGRRLHFPDGTYLLNSVVDAAAGSYYLSGQNAVIRYASTLNYGIRFAAGTSQVVVDGLQFQGDDNDIFEENYWAALYFLTDVTDVKVVNCHFEQCKPVTYASDENNVEGRLIFYGNTVHNAPNAINGPSYAIIANNHFYADEVVSTRSQAVYLFGATYGCLVIGNVFRNIAGETIQIRSSTSHYQQRYSFIIANNHFENSEVYAVWMGTDEMLDMANAVVIGNTFRNSASVNVRGMRTTVVANNSFHSDWEFPFALGGGTSSAIAITGNTASNQYGQSQSVVVRGNIVSNRHPYVGTVTVNADPVDGDTLTVGSKVYTWRNTASVPYDLQIWPGDTRNNAAEIRWALVGDSTIPAPTNPILRDLNDAQHNLYTTLGGATNVVMIASGETFALSETGSNVVCSSVEDYRVFSFGVAADFTKYAVIEGNTVDYCLGGISVTRSYAPTIRNNTIVHPSNASIIGQANALSLYEGNRRIGGLASSERDIICSDGFPVFRGNGLRTNQEADCPETLGIQGLVPVSDGKGKCFLFYGQEVSPGSATALSGQRWRWSDGDTVELTGTGRTTLTLTFKRTSPGANEFNDPDSLIAAVNASSDWEADYAPFTDVGSTNQPMLLLLKTTTDGGAGDAKCYVTTNSLICGVTLRAEGESYARFLGECDTTVGVGAVKTAIFTQLAHDGSVILAQGVDTDSQSLAPVVYRVNIVPGAGAEITHSASVTGAEAFAWFIPGGGA